MVQPAMAVLPSDFPPPYDPRSAIDAPPQFIIVVSDRVVGERAVHARELACAQAVAPMNKPQSIQIRRHDMDCLQSVC